MAWGVTVNTSELENMIRSCTESLEGEQKSNCGIELEGNFHIPIEQITPKIIHKLSISSKYSGFPLLRNILGYPFLNYQIIYFNYASNLSFTKRAIVLLFQRFLSFVKQKILILLNILL